MDCLADIPGGDHPSPFQQKKLVPDVSSNFGILHPIRFFHAHNLNSLNTIRVFTIFVSHCGSRLFNLVVLREDLHATNMRILSILMVLQHAYLHHKCPQLSLATHTDALKIDINPAPRLFTTPFVERDLSHPPHHQSASSPSRSSEIETHKIIHPSPTPKLHLRRRITLIQLKIQVDPHLDNLDQLEKVYGEQVRLRTVRLPELARIEVAEGVDAAGGLVGRDGPGGEGRDFAKADEGGVLRCRHAC